MTGTIIRRKRKNRKKRRTVVFRDAPITALLSAAVNIADRTLLILAIYSGLRLGELLGLRWADLDLRARRIRVSRSSNGGVISHATTEQTIRHVDLPMNVVRSLRIYRSHLVSRPGDFVFRREDGRPLNHDRARRMLTRTCQKAGVPHINWHGLRRNYASMLFNAGVPFQIIRQQLGYVDCSTLPGIVNRNEAGVLPPFDAGPRKE